MGSNRGSAYVVSVLYRCNIKCTCAYSPMVIAQLYLYQILSLNVAQSVPVMFVSRYLQQGAVV